MQSNYKLMVGLFITVTLVVVFGLHSFAKATNNPIIAETPANITAVDGNFVAVEMLSDTTAWAASSDGTFYYLATIQNNVSEWDYKQSLGEDIRVTDISFVNGTNGWAVGAKPASGTVTNGAIWHYDGTTWQLYPSAVAATLHGIDMFSASVGWAVGESRVLRFANNAWSLDTTIDPYGPRDVDALAANHVWVTGFPGVFYNNGSGWQQAEPTNWSGGGPQALDMLSANDGWSVRNDGKIYHYNGAIWSAVTSPTTNALTDIQMLSANEGWAVGASGTILKYNGTSWQTVSSPTSQKLNAIFMWSSSRGKAVGDDGTILGYNNGVWSIASFRMPATCATLTVTVNPVNAGSVGTSPAPDCPNNNAKYKSDTNITLIASANQGYNFSIWSGDFYTATNPTMLTLGDHDTSIIANFEPVPCYTINHGSNNAQWGTVRINWAKTNRNFLCPPSDNESRWQINGQVWLDAVPNAGYRLKTWQGMDTLPNPENTTPVYIDMYKDRSITAIFEQNNRVYGFITDAETQTAIAGAQVHISGNGITPLTDTTDGNGYYEFVGLPAGEYHLAVSHQDYNAQGSGPHNVPPSRQVDYSLRRVTGPTATPTNTPAPTPIVTVTSSPVATPGPVPTPIKTVVPTPAPKIYPVIFIPGIAGSQLKTKDGYLWPIYLDGPKAKLSLKPGERDDSIYTDDVTRKFVVDLYNPLLYAFKEEDYVEYVTNGDPALRTVAGCDTSQTSASLFIFPWDWRFGVAASVDPALSLSPNNIKLLGEFIECIRLIHPGKKVQIVAHSMGGLLSRAYILENPGNHSVARLISINTPWLGAPKALNSILTGEFETKILGKDTAKTLLEYFPGGHQLLPNRQYYGFLANKSQYPLEVVADWPKDKSKLNITYEDFDSRLRRLYRPPNEGINYRSSVAFMGNNEKLFGDTRIANWNGDTSGVEYFVVTGYGKIDDTIVKVVQDIRYDKRCVYCVFKSQIDLVLGQGDETVPTVSQTRKGNGLDLAGPAVVYRFGPPSGNTEHLGITANDSVQACIFNILDSGRCLNVLSANNLVDEESDPAVYHRFWGVKSLQVTDGISTTENLMTRTLTLDMFPDLSLNYLGDDGAILIMSDSTKLYTITVGTSGMDLHIESSLGTGNVTQKFQSFTPTEIVTGTNIALTTSYAETAKVTVDTNGDSVPDTVIPPNANLDKEAADDTLAPIVMIEYRGEASEVAISASDHESGIEVVLYSTDGEVFSPYTGVVKIDPVTVKTVFAVAIDLRGNMGDSKIEIPLSSGEDKVFLPIITR